MLFRPLIRRFSFLVLFLSVLSVWTALPDMAWGSNLSVAPVAQLPELSLKFGSDNGQPSQVAMTVELLLMLTVLSLAPSILIMMTSFTRIIVVLSFLRQAMGTAQVPPNQVMIGLSLFLTFFIMAPVYKTMDDTAITPYLEKRMAPDVALTEAMKPVRNFMMKQVRKKDLALFMKIGHLPEKVKSPDDIPTYVLIPAFVISELSTAFEMGFMIYLPFLILDMVVSSVLMSMGMMMLPPTVVSMPFKILLFVLVDGWSLVVGSLVQSFH
ncbi:flagellar type III secretion system pore protein FliP [Leptospirillum ferrooxidans]|uniref:Flagellar biosynthetic protein FliP n=1 Tax=Leptospirillum ferrooxidans (strain C2-3) TaxID=1162668 RepID=I0IL55_LEPFC|nr:flagellar type III secretion system pore protein FliP [Leptospirillum ferrooxidans]BAM06004.1 flagellar biosynthetic protein [Leptospirillum ferrooxidans C2-3]